MAFLGPHTFFYSWAVLGLILNNNHMPATQYRITKRNKTYIVCDTDSEHVRHFLFLGGLRACPYAGKFSKIIAMRN